MKDGIFEVLKQLETLTPPFPLGGHVILVLYSGYDKEQYDLLLGTALYCLNKKIELCFRGYIYLITDIGYDDAYSIILKGVLKDEQQLKNVFIV